MWDSLRLNYCVVYLEFKRQRVWLIVECFPRRQGALGSIPQTRRKNYKTPVKCRCT